MSQPKLLALLAVLAIVLSPPVAHARGGGGMGGFGAGRMPQQIGRPHNTFNRPDTARNEMRQIARAIQHRDAVGRPTDSRALSAALERDARGALIVRGEIIALAPTKVELEAAQRLNFTIRSRDDLTALGISSVTLQAPAGMTAMQALAAMRAAAPSGIYDFAHIYNPSGEAGGTYRIEPADTDRAEHVRVGMIDGGLAERHRALRKAEITVRSVAPGNQSPPTIHGTAIASLLVGKDRRFSGYLPGARLYAADVFGGEADGGSADAIARALNWLAEKGVPVANISLTGPPNVLLAAAVRGFLARGHVLVAAVGNDGPAAAPNYPASYPGVVAVTSVDATRHIALDANRAASGFAAPGVDVRAAHLPDGYAGYSGTSYATPAVTAGFALLLKKPGVTGARVAFDALAQTSSRLGPLYLIAPATLSVRSQ